MKPQHGLNINFGPVTTFKGPGKAKRHFWGVFKSFKSIISGVTQPLGIFFHVVGSMISWHVP